MIDDLMIAARAAPQGATLLFTLSIAQMETRRRHTETCQNESSPFPLLTAKATRRLATRHARVIVTSHQLSAIGTAAWP